VLDQINMESQTQTKYKEPNRFYPTILLYHTYLAAESGGDQGGHDDHGDDDLDGGGDGSSHVECMFIFPVDQCKRMKSRIMS
jgi:hypothetical protein